VLRHRFGGSSLHGERNRPLRLSMASKTILVVDDAASVRTQLRLALESEGFTVLEAENGQRGYDTAAAQPVDLMIVDVNMPVMDGFEMIARVRSLDRYSAVPIFVLTTESGMATVRQGKAAGATAWIVKPVKPEVLVKGIRGILGA
jgi:two-component system chemotaxis response regulator CheY